MPIFDQAHSKIIEITFCFPEFTPPCKKSVHFLNAFLRYSQFRVLWPNWSHPFLTTHIQKFLDQLLIYVNLYDMTKPGYFIDLFWRYGWLKNAAIWLAENILAHISGTFSQIWDLHRNTANKINFHYRSNSVNINDQIFQ